MNTIKKTFLVIALMTTTAVTAQTTNSVYIDQVGDGSNITVTQTGQGNKVGNKTANEPLTLDGNGQIVDLLQNGNTNSIIGDIKQNDGSSTTVESTGDNNTVTFDVGNSGATSGSTTLLTVEGSSNDVKLTQGATSSATNATQNITLTGDQNKYTSTIEANDVTNNVTVTGDSNEFVATQTNGATKDITATITGSSNKVTISQSSSLNADSITVTSTGSSNIYNINQCNSGGC